MGKQEAGTEPEVTKSLTSMAIKGTKDPTPEEPYPGEMEGFEPSSPEDRGDNLEAAPAPQPEATEPEATEPEVTASEEPSDPVTKEAAPEPEKPKREPKIPKSRFDEINEKYKAAKEALEQLQAEREAETQATEGGYDFDAAEQEYLEFVLDGKTAEAAAKRREIRAAERAQIEAEIEAKSSNTVEVKSTQQQILDLSNKYAEEFPAFDPQDESFDAEAIEEVKALYTGYYTQSQNAVLSFQKAVEAVVKLRGWDAPAATEEPAPEPEPQKPSPKQVTAKVEMAKKQPTNLAGVGEGSTKHGMEVNVAQLSEKEFDALPESTKARLRGDFM